MRGIIFDLDGTLCDTVRDIALSANHVLERHGLRAVAAQHFRTMVGDGAAMLMRRAAPGASPGLLEQLLAEFRAQYLEHMLDSTHPYPGIAALLEELGSRRIPLAVLSNKPEDAAQRMAEALFPSKLFRAVRGQRPGVPIKPDPTAALELALELAVAPASCMFVGDSGVDMQTARSAGMVPIGVAWGFRGQAELEQHGAERVIREPQELIALLSQGG